MRFGFSFASRTDLLAYVVAYYASFIVAAGVFVAGMAFVLGQSVLSGASLQKPLEFGGLQVAIVVFGAVFVLVGFWINAVMAACARQAALFGKYSFEEAKEVATQRFPSIIGVTLLNVAAALAISFLAGLLEGGSPVLASMLDAGLSFLVSLVFLYPHVEVVVNGAGAFEAVRRGAERFSDSPLKTIFFFLARNALALAALGFGLLVGVFAFFSVLSAVLAAGVSPLVAFGALLVGIAWLALLLACLAFAAQASIGMLALAVLEGKSAGAFKQRADSKRHH